MGSARNAAYSTPEHLFDASFEPSISIASQASFLEYLFYASLRTQALPVSSVSLAVAAAAKLSAAPIDDRASTPPNQAEQVCLFDAFPHCRMEHCVRSQHAPSCSVSLPHLMPMARADMQAVRVVRLLRK